MRTWSISNFVASSNFLNLNSFSSNFYEFYKGFTLNTPYTDIKKSLNYFSLALASSKPPSEKFIN